KRAAVAHFVIEQRMRDQRTHALLIHLKEAFASRGTEVYGLAGAHEILFRNDPIIYTAQDRGLGHQRTKLFHEVQPQGWTAKARLMVKADVRIEPDRQRRKR